MHRRFRIFRMYTNSRRLPESVNRLTNRLNLINSFKGVLHVRKMFALVQNLVAGCGGCRGWTTGVSKGKKAI